MTYSKKFMKAWLGDKSDVMDVPLSLKVSLSGRYTLIKGSESRGEHVIAEFDNLITNGGLNRMGSTTNPLILHFCQVGTGSTAPAFTDTSLANRFASHSSIESTTNTLATESNPYVETSRRYRFNAGVFDNTVISEVGIGWASTGSLFSRALILDGEGDPTTITLLDDEYLDVVYTLRLHIPLTDVTGTITINTIDYDYTLRASKAANWLSVGGGGAGIGNLDFRVIKDVAGYNGNIRPSIWTNSDPSGTENSFTTDTATASYVGGFTNTFPPVTAGLNSCNFAEGLVSVYFEIGNAVEDIRFQAQFDPPIPKTASQIFTLTVSVSWGRA